MNKNILAFALILLTFTSAQFEIFSQDLELEEKPQNSSTIEDAGIHGYVNIGDEIGSIHYSFYPAKNATKE